MKIKTPDELARERRRAKDLKRLKDSYLRSWILKIALVCLFFLANLLIMTLSSQENFIVSISVGFVLGFIMFGIVPMIFGEYPFFSRRLRMRTKKMMKYTGGILFLPTGVFILYVLLVLEMYWPLKLEDLIQSPFGGLLTSITQNVGPPLSLVVARTLLERKRLQIRVHHMFTTEAFGIGYEGEHGISSARLELISEAMPVLLENRGNNCVVITHILLEKFPEGHLPADFIRNKAFTSSVYCDHIIQLPDSVLVDPKHSKVVAVLFSEILSFFRQIWEHELHPGAPFKFFITAYDPFHEVYYRSEPIGSREVTSEYSYLQHLKAENTHRDKDKKDVESRM